jgi:hypothetical protein
MIVEYTKNGKNHIGRLILKGKQIEVTNEKGKELIKSGFCKEVDGVKFAKLMEEKFNKIEQE